MIDAALAIRCFEKRDVSDILVKGSEKPVQIYMKEVNFGEAILLKQDDNKLLVDCGAKYGKKGVTAACAVKSHLASGRKEALVTHFDEDHYNGLTELAGKVQFDKIYLPLYSYSRGKGVVATGGLLDDTVKVWAYQKIMRKGKKLDALHRFFTSLPLLVDSRTKVQCVGKGDTVYCDQKQLKVLWPEYSFMQSRRTYSSEIENMLKRYEFEECVTAVNDYVSAFVAIYATYADGEANGESDYIEDQLWEWLQSAYHALDQMRFERILGEKDTRRLSSILSAKITCMNDCSVVLEEKGELLMLGDIGKSVFEHQIYSELTGKYKVVKISHHGTKAYYSARIPKAKVYLISNSGDKYENWGIYQKYPDRFPDYMRCTNTEPKRCKTQGSRCRMCSIGQPSGDRMVDLDAL